MLILRETIIVSNRIRILQVARMEEGTTAFKFLTGKPIGKKLPRRLMHRREDDIIMDLKEIGVNRKDWVDSD